MNTTPSAICQGATAPGGLPRGRLGRDHRGGGGERGKTKKKFSPIPGAWAIGYRAYRPMITVASAAERQVAVVTAPNHARRDAEHAPDSTAGCTKMM